MYESFYRLSGKPFQLSPDPRFFYESQVHKRAYAYLKYGLHQAEGFIVITGEVGAGKTLLVRNLLQHLDSREVVAAHLVSTQLDADELLRAVAAALGLPTKGNDKAAILADVERFLHRLAAERRRALLIVDEAQNLTPRAVEELRMLSNFQLNGSALLQSFLVGQPELRRTLQGPDMQQFRQRVIASYHLSRLEPQETRAYIEHRLRQVAWRGDPKFEDGAYDAIFQSTDGIPRRINLLCNRLLLAGFLNENHRLYATDVELVVTEMKEELGIVGRPGELGHSQAEQPQDKSRVQPNEVLVGAPHTLPHPERVSEDKDGAPPPEWLGRVTRLERALAHVVELLRRRTG